MTDKKVNNLSTYNAVRTPPKEALKDIQAGRLRGMTDINPMWRLKTLTEQFGVCGIGWKYAITKQWLELGSSEQQAAFVNIDLFIKVDNEWSAAIPGTGGSLFVASESKGLHTSDECFKMALTDAISVACKALGFAADIYWNKDRTKYDQVEQVGNPKDTPEEKAEVAAVMHKKISEIKVNMILEKARIAKVPLKQILDFCKVNIVEEINESQFAPVMAQLQITLDSVEKKNQATNEII